MDDFYGFLIMPVGDSDFNDYRYSTYALDIQRYRGNYVVVDEYGNGWRIPSNEPHVFD